ncbi:hypothetical protein L1987_38333 [Smallanthus sonchifolius]|uniref:Uncharacterized protein n=1 Tax=Smallanthus sonchifolius TaxID=185202 RepID=A0ACB9HK41_9ASTR|nr:hypothetical protein L1987_38333 [Smallanthus sonchifolius]
MSVDIEAQILLKLVYVAREKRTRYSHNFKAGALNALIRVSSVISNGPIILTVDCDVYSDNSESVRDAMCCFMDEENGNKISYVQFPQSSYNITTHDLYASCFRVPNELEMGGMDANGGPCYIGKNTKNEKESTSVIQDRCKPLACCTYEKGTQRGEEIGLKYGFPSEDFVTDTLLRGLGVSEMGFTVTPKVVDEDVLWRYKKDVMEFGSASGMFTGLAFIAMLNFFVLFWSLKTMDVDRLALQIGLCVFAVCINFLVYEGLFVRKDEGKMPSSVTCNSVILALIACMLVFYS